MGSLRTINHPGVEIREYDVSQYTPAVGGTTSLIMGFASKGEYCVPLEITSRNSFLSYFGTPSNEAERYFYYAADEIFSQGGRCIAAKIPYNNISKDVYLGNTYSVSVLSTINSFQTSAFNGDFTANNLSGYTEVHTITCSSNITPLSLTQIDSYRLGTGAPTLGTFQIIDKTRETLKTNILSKDSTSNEIIGYFPVVVTALNALPMQNLLPLSAFTTNNSTEWMAISSIQTSSTINISQNDFAISLATSSIFDNSLSKSIVQQFPSITYDDNGLFDSENMDKILVAIVSMKNDANYNNKINFSVVESFYGSLDKNSKNIQGESDYIGNVINANSSYIEFYSNLPSDRLVQDGQIYKVITQKAGIYGFTTAQTLKTIEKDVILTSIDTILDRLSNIDEVELDLVVDAGLSNIAQYISSVTPSGSGVYDPDGFYSANAWEGPLTNRDDTLVWRAVIGKLLTFCSSTRKDCMAIVDGLRPLCLTGSQKMVRAGSTSTIDIDILGNLKNIVGINSNYGAMYINWYKYLDTFSGNTFWVPQSIPAVGSYVYTDRSADYWDAPAGFTRGISYNALDIAFNPTGKQQDAIYSKSFNYAVNYPTDGIVIEGQKTLQVKPSAFDRVNVRKLFLKLERLTYKTVRYYKYQPNNIYTRTRILDQLKPIYEDVKARGGIYDFKLICDSSNNTDLVLDNNELRLAVLIKPTKTAEFILCDFYNLSSGMSFNEVYI